jgi:hypothetical protein
MVTLMHFKLFGTPAAGTFGIVNADGHMSSEESL